jgi:hypothetical protein
MIIIIHDVSIDTADVIAMIEHFPERKSYLFFRDGRHFAIHHDAGTHEEGREVLDTVLRTDGLEGGRGILFRKSEISVRNDAPGCIRVVMSTGLVIDCGERNVTAYPSIDYAQLPPSSSLVQ